MCGIVGHFSTTNRINIDQFKNSISSIHHRGPDDNGYWLSKNNQAALGSVRLSIIDLTKNGHMPMHDDMDLVHLVFNGEIYNYKEVKEVLLKKNHQFKSGTDTEVILKAYLEWGESFIDKFNGMFAIAIYDERENKLFLYRDRAGEKPIYYYHHGGVFIFGSELRTILNNPEVVRMLNYQSLGQYLRYGYCDNDSTLIQHVKKLKAGFKLILDFNSNELSVQSFWSIPELKMNQVYSKEELCSELSGLLEAAVSRQLISDVPTGVLLSGGLDSSLVTAFAAKVSREKIKTFHIHFDGMKQYDEKQYADIVADHFDTDHHVLSGSELSLDDLDFVLNKLDEPLADSSLLPTYLVCQLTRQEVKVALGGDGCDELFGGYTSYEELLKFGKKNTLFKKGSSVISNCLPIGFKGKQYTYANSLENNSDFIKKSNFFNDAECQNILSHKAYNKLKAVKSGFSGNLTGVDGIDQMTRNDFRHFMCDDVLVKVDRMSMLNSLEVRAPWLDREIIEFAFSKVPSHLKVTDVNKKILPKLLAEKILPSKLDINRKQGFSIPLSQWLTGKWKNYFETQLGSVSDNLFKQDVLMQMLHSEKSKYFNNSHRIFAITSLLIWLKKYNIRY